MLEHSKKLLSLVFITIGVAGCGSLSLPEYRRAADYHSHSDEYRSSPRPERGGQIPYQPQSAFQLSWPVRYPRVTQHFATRRNPNHEGIDIAGHRGKKIYAAHEGLVIYVGREFSGYGRMVMIEYDDQWATLYAHLNSYDVRTGDRVKRKTLIGRMGDSGNARGVHLHFELLKRKKPVNPVKYLGRAGKIAKHRDPL